MDPPQHCHQTGRCKGSRCCHRVLRRDIHQRLFNFICYVLFREFISLLQSLFALCMLILLLKSMIAAHRVHQLQPLFRQLGSHIVKFILDEMKEAVGLPRSKCSTAYCQAELPAALQNLSCFVGSNNRLLHTSQIARNFANFLDTKHDFRQVQGHLTNNASLDGYEIYEKWCRIQNFFRSLKLLMQLISSLLSFLSIPLLCPHRH